MSDATAADHCFHCGTLCLGPEIQIQQKVFCCLGCRAVFELLAQSGLGGFYDLAKTAGGRGTIPSRETRFQFLDEPDVRARLMDFADGRSARVTFRVPTIHCIACVWLLENLFRLHPGLGSSHVNFPRKEVAISFDPQRSKLSEVVTLLASLGYEPEIKFSDLEGRPGGRTPRRLWLQLGIAGFAFGNSMLFSISSYFGLDVFSGPGFRTLVGWISLALAIPVVIYSAADYWRSAWISLRQRLLNIDVPIAAGLAALFGQSAYEVLSGRGEGYFDSLCGLLFFLLCGRLFQQKTFDRLAFDRDYKSFFPLSITRRSGRRLSREGGVAEALASKSEIAEERVSLSHLAVGDRLLLRNGELIPADSHLMEGPALIDYSFVTGESEPVPKTTGDYLYAGGRQMGAAIEVETVKPVSQSYLTSLWNQDAFRKAKPNTLNVVTNAYSQQFTRIIMAIALGAAAVWALINPAVSLKAFTSVLIVACPCALALAAPFALGTAQRVMAQRNVFLKNPYVIESLAQVDAIVFDKTGTLTVAGPGSVTWQGTPLNAAEERWLCSLTRHSTHPLSVRIGDTIGGASLPEPVGSFLETPGFGMQGVVAGHQIRMGSEQWLEAHSARGAAFTPLHRENSQTVQHGEPAWKEVALKRPEGRAPGADGSAVHLAIDGQYRGYFLLVGALRPETRRLVAGLSGHYELALLSGDNEKERENFSELFGRHAQLHFHQSPLEKLEFIQRLQQSRRTVMMVGDGLNDAGALRQSDVGVAVVENVGAFSPASDVIIAAGMVACLPEALRFAKQSMRVVRGAFLISTLYNIVGISIAASGLLSPVVCAILMPLSSVTVVAFACGVTSWFGRRIDTVADAAGEKSPGLDLMTEERA